MIEAHLICEIFIEGIKVPVDNFAYIIWESGVDKSQTLYFEYYIKNSKIESVIIQKSEIASIRLCDRRIGLKSEVRGILSNRN